MAGLTLVVLVIARHSSAVSIRKLWKNKSLWLKGPGNYTAHPGLHSEVVGKEREDVCLQFYFYWCRRWGLRISRGSLFLGEFKTQEWKFKAGREKTSGPNGHLSKSTKISKAKETQWGEVVWLFTQCSWQCVFLREPSLNWMPQQSKSGTCTEQKEKTQLSGLILYIFIPI